MKKFLSLLGLVITLNSFAAITLSPTSLPNGLTGHTYSQTVVATGGSGGYIYTLMSGSFPTGYTLGLQNGVFGGICIVAGSYTFRIRATGRSSDTVSRSYTITISNVTLTSTSQFVNIWNSRYVPEYAGLWDTYNNLATSSSLGLYQLLSQKSTDTTMAAYSNTLYPTQRATAGFVNYNLSLYQPLTQKSTDTTMAAYSNTLYPTQRATAGFVNYNLSLYQPLSQKSTDTTMVAYSNTLYPTQRAVSGRINYIASLKENLANKVTTFTTVDNTSYPTTLSITPVAISQTVTGGGTTTLNAGSLPFQTFYSSSNATATTIAYSNIVEGSNLQWDYQKTTASDLVMTFPGGTIISISGSVSVAGTAATFISTSSGRFLIQITKVNGVYFVYVTQSVA